MISGVESVLNAPPLDEAFEEIVRLTRRWWPDAVFVDANDSEALPLAGPELAWRPASPEFFIFSDRHTAEKWDELGPCPENWNRMFHFICRPEGAGTRITVIADEITQDLSRYLQNLQATFEETPVYAETK